MRPGQGDEIGQVVALALAVDEPGGGSRYPLSRTPAALSTAVSVSTRRTIAPPKASMNGAGISTSGGAKTEAGSATGWSSSKIVGLASALGGRPPEMAEPLVKMSGFPKLAKGLGYHRHGVTVLGEAVRGALDFPMLAVLTLATTWAAGAARLTGSAKSPKTGIKPADRRFAAAELEPRQGQDLMALLRQLSGDGGPDKSGRARDKDLHGASIGQSDAHSRP